MERKYFVRKYRLNISLKKKKKQHGVVSSSILCIKMHRKIFFFFTLYKYNVCYSVVNNEIPDRFDLRNAKLCLNYNDKGPTIVEISKHKVVALGTEEMKDT